MHSTVHLVTPLSLGKPIRPEALRPYLSDKFAFFRVPSSVADKNQQFKEPQPCPANAVSAMIMQNFPERFGAKNARLLVDFLVK